MAVKVAIWNIQNYGGGYGRGGTSPAYWGNNSHLRNCFIRDFVVREEIDVLLIMEAQSTSKSSLDDLRAKLNAGAVGTKDWCSSLCGSAITKWDNPPQSNRVISFRSDARYEGYAVLWRSAQAGRFKLLRGLHDIAQKTEWDPANPAPPGVNGSPLNMVTWARPADNVPIEPENPAKKRRLEPGAQNGGRQQFRALGGYTRPNLYPFRDNQLQDAWSEMDLPATGRAGTFGYRTTRRPVYVVLEMAGGATPAQRLCPVVAYHAPSNAGRARDGTLISGLSRELYVTNGVVPGGVAPDPATLVPQEKVVYGGDYNLSLTKEEWPESDFMHYFVPFAREWTGGAACKEAPDHDGSAAERNTNVSLVSGPDHDIPIPPGPVEAYLTKPLDLIFTRPPDRVTGARVNVILQLWEEGPAGPYANTVRALGAHVDQVVQGLSPKERLSPTHGPEHRVLNHKKQWVWRPMYNGNWGARFESWTAFRADLQAGWMSCPRRAAELYQMFISDHLPLIATIN
ncbi:MAG: hypothetical protein M3335_04975 [Actinomycetota bacterium]|nr:hypothetical protein [Actinomycetota bacterium]